jgi:CHAT domain-containing protein
MARLKLTQFEAAERDAAAGYEFWRDSPESVWHWRFRLALAEALLDQYRYQEAAPLLAGAAPSDELEARRRIASALERFLADDYQEASLSLQAAEDSVPHGQGELRGRLELTRGMLHLAQERWEEAEASFLRATEAVAGSGSAVESYALCDLGFLELRRWRLDEAVFWSSRAREVAERTGALRPLALATGNLGAAYAWLGDLERATVLLEDEIRITGALQDRLYQRTWLATAGQVWHTLGNASKAAEYYQCARALMRPDDTKLPDILMDQAELALERGDIGSAQRLNEEAGEAANRLHKMREDALRPLIAHKLLAADILRVRNEHALSEAAYREAIDLSKPIDDTYSRWRSHGRLASLYSDTGRTREARREYQLAIATIEKQRSRLLQNESKLTFLSHLIRFYRDYVSFLVAQGDAAGAFRVAQSCRARVLAENLNSEGAPAPDLNRLRQQARDTGTVFLSYWLAPQRSLLWVIDSAGLHQFELPPDEQITDRVRRYAGAIERGVDPLASGNGDGRWLFSNLIESHYPVPPSSNVVIVPDGSLHHINFESLPASSGRYWIADVTISIAPSLGVLDRSRHEVAPRLLLIGDPDFESPEFPRLPHAKSEIASVSESFAAKEVYTGSAATPAIYGKGSLDLFSTIHFAAHAVANRESPLDSAIILSGTAGKQKLYARDVLSHPLRAELVTLSACQSAGTRAYYGEGLTGLAWAFLSAGACNVVAGLWQVDDRATAELMRRFYGELAPGRSPAESLRKAKLALIASPGAYRKPYYWAAFETFSRVLY